MSQTHAISAADIMPMAEYGRLRADKRREMALLKRDRRVAVGPSATFYFENRATMWMQIHEMLWIEKGGAAQIPDELEAYNPLIPRGDELVATFMIEIDDPIRRKRVLGQLGGIEETAFISIGGEKIVATPETDQDRTAADGKASSVQFVHFHFTAAQIAAFRAAGAEVILGLSHPNYSHMAVLAEATRAALAGDFD